VPCHANRDCFLLIFLPRGSSVHAP
jgi:hypothetical protein